MFEIDTWLAKLAKKLPFLNMENPLEEARALVHFSTGALWACFFAHLARHSPLWFLSLLPWILYIAYKELLVDGHLERLKNGTETDEEKKDLISDIVTKLSGLLFY